MACSITITGITGFAPDAGLSPDRLEVAGAAVDCAKVCVRVTRQGTGVTTAEVDAVVGAAGGWTAVFEAAQGHFPYDAFACNASADKIEVRAECCDDRSCVAVDVLETLPCDGGRDCPAISGLTATPGACNPDGTRAVSLSATVDPGSAGPVFVQWMHGDEDGASGVFSAPGTFTDSHGYAAGPQTFRVRVMHPAGCADAVGTVTVEECPAAPAAICPSISLAPPRPGSCNKAGERDIALTATLTVTPTATISAELVRLDAAGEVVATIATGQSATGTLELSGTGSFPAGSHTVAVRVLQPSGCGAATFPLAVEACPTVCPAVRFDPAVVGECDDGRRQVTVRARFVPQGPGPFSGRLVLWDTVAQTALQVLDTADSTGSETTIAETLELEPGIYAFVAEVTSPAGCLGASQSVDVPACADDDDDEDEDDDATQDGAINWCAVALVALLSTLVVGAVLLGVMLCLIGLFPEGTVAVVLGIIAAIGAVLLAIASIGLLVWLYLCGSCRENCLMVDILIDTLGVLAGLGAILAIVGGIIAATGLSALCWVGWAIDTLDFGVLLAAAYWWARVVGCRPWPRWVPDWARCRLPDALRLICRRR